MRPLAPVATALAILATATIAPAAAHGAPPWSAPQPAAGASAISPPPALAVGATGAGLLAAPEAVPFSLTPRSSPYRLVGVSATGTTTDRGLVPGGDLATAPVVYGRSRVVLVRRRLVGPARSGGPARVRLTASFGTTGQPASGTERELAQFSSSTGGGVPVAAAADDRGDVAVAWVESPSLETARVRLAIRRPNGRFGAPSTIRVGYAIDAITVAWGSGGDLVVAFNRRLIGRERRQAGSRGVLEARVRRAGASLGSVQRIGPSRGRDRLSAAVAPNGRMVIAWGTNDPGEEVNEPYEVRAAVRPAGPRRFRAAQLLDDGSAASTPGGTFGRVVARMAADGRATVAYTARRLEGGRFVHPVRVAGTDAAARFTASQLLAPEGALGDLAVRADGTAVATWTAPPAEAEFDNPSVGDVQATVRPAGADAFGPTEVVTTGEHATEPRLAFIAGGAPLLAYAAVEQQSSPTRFALRVTRRAAP
jgi:hypothetical protein